MDTGRWGSPAITFRVKDDGFDPIEDDAGGIINSRFIVNLLEDKGVSAAYRYRNGFNEVVFSASRETKKPKIIGGSVTAAAVLGLVCALLCRRFMPAQEQSFLLEDLASPLMSSLMGLIMLITGPLIFTSVVSGICALEDVVTLSSISLRVIFRFFVITVLLITFSMLVCFPFFPGLAGMSEGAFSIPEILHLLFELIPKDIVSPFVEGKTIQIILLAALFGISILMLGNSVSKRPDFSQIVDMMDRAFLDHPDTKGLILHSNQGWQYQMYRFSKILDEHGITQSMSRKDNSLDNGLMENFFGLIKTEIFYDQEDRYETLDELIRAIEDYIHYYNNERTKSRLKGLTPMEYRNQALMNP